MTFNNTLDQVETLEKVLIRTYLLLGIMGGFQKKKYY